MQRERRVCVLCSDSFLPPACLPHPPPRPPASSSTNEEDLVLDGSTSGARVSRAGEAAYREVLASEADSDVIDTSLVLVRWPRVPWV